MDASSCCLLVIDIQAKLNPVMFDPDRAPKGTAQLFVGAQTLAVPAVVTEQYSRGVGATVDDLQDFMPDGSPLEKNTFSALADPDIGARVRGLGKKQVVLAGIETHICVLQTALDLLAGGAEVFVVGDASASRTRDNHRAGLERMRQAGATVVTVEMVLFEWLRRSGTAEFKTISGLIK